MAAVRKGFKFTAKGASVDDGTKNRATSDESITKNDKRKVKNDDVITTGNHKKYKKGSAQSDGKWTPPYPDIHSVH